MSPDGVAPGKLTGLTVDAIIVNFRTPRLTQAAVVSLHASRLAGAELRVWLVDNHSEDDSVDFLRASLPGIPLLVSETNLGFSGGNNLALRRILDDLPDDSDGQHRYVLLLNSDVEVEPTALGIALEFMLEHPDAGIAGARVLLSDGRLDLACRRGFPTPARSFWKLTGLAKRFPNNPRFTGYNLTHRDEHETTEVDATTGAFMLVRLAAIQQAGLLDEQFFMYGEDLDWAYRIKEYGWKVFYVAPAVVHHLKGASSRKQSRKLLAEFYRAMWLFHRKHYASRSPRLFNWLILSGIIARGGLALAINAARPSEAKRVS